MAQRETSALWLLPIAYVVAYRVLAQVSWRLVVAMGDRAAMTPAFSLVLTGACALAIGCLCVYVHGRVVGPLPVSRSFVMAAIAIPMLMVGHVVTMGVECFTRYVTIAPLQAGFDYPRELFGVPPPGHAVGAQRAGAPASDGGVRQGQPPDAGGP